MNAPTGCALSRSTRSHLIRSPIAKTWPISPSFWAARMDARTIAYVAAFLHGVSVTAEDRALESAACDLAQAHSSGAPILGPVSRLAGLVQARVQDAIAL